MKRMWSKNELKNISQNEAKAVKKDIATLVDAQGHERFIEGDITTPTIEGVTFTYKKWSLSGTHLMAVLAGSIENGAELPSTTWGTATVPDYVFDKIVPVIGVNVTFKTITLYNEDYSQQTISAIFQKYTNNRFQIYCGTLTATKSRNFRIEFDLLIDNE